MVLGVDVVVVIVPVLMVPSAFLTTTGVLEGVVAGAVGAGGGGAETTRDSGSATQPEKRSRRPQDAETARSRFGDASGDEAIGVFMTRPEYVGCRVGYMGLTTDHD